MISKIFAFLLGAVALAPFALADADADALLRSRALSSIEFTTENDAYGALGGDRYYTNGFKLAYVTPSWSDAGDATTERAHFGVEQEMYTPESIAAPAPGDDHPYSAWLYAMAGLGWETDSTLDLLTLRIGVVGPSALGKQIQGNAHDIMGFNPFPGWNSQLKDEPGIDLEWTRTWRVALSGTGNGWSTELLPRLNLEGGTVRDFASTGVQYRFGQNVPRDFGVKSSRDSGVDGVPVKFDRSPDAGWAPDAWYGFIDLQAEAWGRNMALDGNLWHDSDAVHTNVFVGQGGFGVAAFWGGTKFAFSQFVRTKEFSGQNGIFCFGSITINVTF